MLRERPQGGSEVSWTFSTISNFLSSPAVNLCLCILQKVHHRRPKGESSLFIPTYAHFAYFDLGVFHNIFLSTLAIASVCSENGCGGVMLNSQAECNNAFSKRLCFTIAAHDDTISRETLRLMHSGSKNVLEINSCRCVLTGKWSARPLSLFQREKWAEEQKAPARARNRQPVLRMCPANCIVQCLKIVLLLGSLWCFDALMLNRALKSSCFMMCIQNTAA